LETVAAVPGLWRMTLEAPGELAAGERELRVTVAGARSAGLRVVVRR
jgi:hypothetical protein